MQTLFEYQDDECPWYHIDSSFKSLLGSCLTVLGVFGVLLNGWLFATFVHSHLVVYKSHLLVLNLCSASLGRNLLGFPFAGSSAIARRWVLSLSCCQLFAFLNQFFGVFQMTAIFVLVLERYLVAKCYRREKIIYFRFYVSSIAFCLVSALVFSIPPLFGYGIYSCDATGTICTFMWPSTISGAKQFIFAVPYIIFCAVLPVVAMFYYMGKALDLERIFYRGEHKKEDRRLTKSVHAITVATLALWFPAAILAGWQWLPLLVYGYRPHVPPVLAVVAPIASEAATSIPVLCYLLLDERLRRALLGRMRKRSAPVSSELVKLYDPSMAE